MRRRNALRLLISGILALASAAERASAAEAEALDVEAVADANCLRFKAINLSSENVELQSANLPWGDRYSLTILGVPATRGASPLAVARPISIPRHGKSVISPSTQVEGEVDLRHYIQEFAVEVQKGPMLVFWAWTPVLGPPHLILKSGVLRIDPIQRVSLRTCKGTGDYPSK